MSSASPSSPIPPAGPQPGPEPAREALLGARSSAPADGESAIGESAVGTSAGVTSAREASSSDLPESAATGTPVVRADVSGTVVTATAFSLERRALADRRQAARESGTERRRPYWATPAEQMAVRRAVPNPSIDAGPDPVLASGAADDVSVASSPVHEPVPDRRTRTRLGAARPEDARHSAAPSARDAADLSELAPLRRGDLATLLDELPEPVYVVDRRWRFRYVNRQAAALWGTTPDALIGRSLWAVHPRGADAHAYERLAHAMRHARSERFDAPHDADGPRVEVSALPLASGLLVLHRDAGASAADDPLPGAARRAARQALEEVAAELRVSRQALEEARQAVRRAEEQAVAARAAKSDFLATMSHELRTPINAITGYAQLLELGLAGPVSASQREFLDRVLTSSRHLLGLVDDVLDFARLEGGQLTVAPEPLAAPALVDDALAVVAPQAAARGVRVDFPRAATSDAQCAADPHRVRQILVNLLSNAVKFTPRGGRVAVEIAAPGSPVGAAAWQSATARPDASPHGATLTADAAGWVQVRVHDTGIGISPALQEAIFEPFVQVDGSRTRTAGGTGLGLAISRRLARLMGGELTVESAPHEGATFTLWLPTRSRVDASATDAADDWDEAHDPESPGAANRDDRVLAPPLPRHQHGRAALLPLAGAPVSQRTAPTDDDAGLPPAPLAPAVAELLPGDQRVARRFEGLGIVGSQLRRELEPLLARFVERLRADVLLPQSAILSRTQLEHHVPALLTDLAQWLLSLEESRGLDAELLEDGSAIQEQIAARHGEQRHRLAWSQGHVRREYAILRDELERLVRAGDATGDFPQRTLALTVIRRFVARARDASLRAWRQAAARASTAAP